MPRKNVRSRARVIEDSESETSSPSESDNDSESESVGRPAKKRAKVSVEGRSKSKSLKLRSKEGLSQADKLTLTLLEGNKDGIYSDLQLKVDHSQRPIWVLPSGEIFLEAHSRFYRQAYDFLVAIAEPVSRPKYLHEYKLTPHSLLSAVSINLTAVKIVSVLDKLSKVRLPKNVSKYITQATINFGKAKLVLKQRRLFVEAPDVKTLDKLLSNSSIAAARIETETTGTASGKSGGYTQTRIDENGQEGEADPDIQFLKSLDATSKAIILADEGDHDDVEAADDDEDEGAASAVKNVYSFEIAPTQIEQVKRAALRMDFPLTEEYDFRKDASNTKLAIEMKTTTTIRPYQERCLSKMFGNGRARSGIIVLPCGAGKTLTGISACVTIKKNTIILCPSGVAVTQWKRQFLLFTTVNANRICCFSSKMKDELPTGPCILLTTYSMLAAGGKRSDEAQDMLDKISATEWGLMILDEVHVVPAKLFRRVVTKVKTHCKLGLTATLVREDGLIVDLNFLVGPKLYEANWLDLTRDGFIANVLCSEVWCPMTAEFYSEYLHEKNRNVKNLLYVLNPMKCLACDYLMKHHEGRGDKILIFCDNIYAIEYLQSVLNRPCITGKTPEKERLTKFASFRKSVVSNTLLISKVGDVAIDLPEATVLIQISSHFGSRRQEAQRLGRILRPKEGMGKHEEGSYNAFFYSLVSVDTQEMIYCGRRQRYLVDNGYTFRVVTNIAEIALASAANGVGTSHAIAKLAQKDEQLALLAKLLTKNGSSSLEERVESSESELEEIENTEEKKNDDEAETSSAPSDDEDDDLNSDSEASEAPKPVRPAVQRSTMNAAQLSGAGTLNYLEYNTSEAV